MLEYLSLDIICSSKLTVLLKLHSRKTVHFLEQIVSRDKYSSIILFFYQMEVVVCMYQNMNVKTSV